MALIDDFNNEREEEVVRNLDQEKRKWYEIPTRRVNYFHKFDFNLVNFKTEGLLFLTFILFIPFGAAIIVYAVFPELSVSSASLTTNIIAVICATIGFFISFTRVREKFWHYGLAFGYLFIMIPELAVVIGSIILSAIASGKSASSLEIYDAFFSQICQIVAEVIIIMWFFLKTKDGWATIKMTIKENWKMLLLVVLCCFAVMYLLSQVIFGLVVDKIFHTGDSINQANLTKLIHNQNNAVRITYIILLFVSSILIAPLCEEICTRFSFFGNTGNKWWALVMCTIYFGYIHCGQAGDFDHLPAYLAAGFVLSMTFIISRGNLTYTWLTHMLSNLVSFILILVI